MHPLRHRLEVVHRFAALDFDESREPLPFHQHEIGKKRVRADLHRRDAFFADVGQRLELSLVFALKMPNQAVVLELFADGSYENWRHADSSRLGRTPELPNCRPGSHKTATVS